MEQYGFGLRYDNAKENRLKSVALAAPRVCGSAKSKEEIERCVGKSNMVRINCDIDPVPVGALNTHGRDAILQLIPKGLRMLIDLIMRATGYQDLGTLVMIPISEVAFVNYKACVIAHYTAQLQQEIIEQIHCASSAVQIQGIIQEQIKDADLSLRFDSSSSIAQVSSQVHRLFTGCAAPHSETESRGGTSEQLLHILLAPVVGAHNGVVVDSQGKKLMHYDSPAMLPTLKQWRDGYNTGSMHMQTKYDSWMKNVAFVIDRFRGDSKIQEILKLLADTSMGRKLIVELNLGEAPQAQAAPLPEARDIALLPSADLVSASAPPPDVLSVAGSGGCVGVEELHAQHEQHEQRLRAIAEEPRPIGVLEVRQQRLSALAPEVCSFMCHPDRPSNQCLQIQFPGCAPAVYSQCYVLFPKEQEYRQFFINSSVDGHLVLSAPNQLRNVITLKGILRLMRVMSPIDVVDQATLIAAHALLQYILLQRADAYLGQFRTDTDQYVGMEVLKPRGFLTGMPVLQMLPGACSSPTGIRVDPAYYMPGSSVIFFAKGLAPAGYSSYTRRAAGVLPYTEEAGRPRLVP